MKEEYELKLQDEFSFMKRDMTIKDRSTIRNIYQAWGCECSEGWYPLIRELCQAITDRYTQDGIPVDIVVEQIKEKFASLRFYYSFEDTPCALHAIDFLGGSSLRFEPHNKNDDEKRESSEWICLGKGHFVMSAIIIILKSLMKDRENNK